MPKRLEGIGLKPGVIQTTKLLRHIIIKQKDSYARVLCDL